MSRQGDRLGAGSESPHEPASAVMGWRGHVGRLSRIGAWCLWEVREKGKRRWL